MSVRTESSSEESSDQDEEREFQMEKTDFVPYRVFMNQIDSFNAKYIASYLTDQYYGPPPKIVETPNQGEEHIAEEEFKIPEIKEEEVHHKFEIIGTTTSSVSKKTEDVSYIIEEDGKYFKEELARCAYIIYDITRDRGEIPKALNTLEFLVKELDKIKEAGPKNYRDYPNERVFILISTVMTWARTKLNEDDEGGITPFSDANYRKRKAHLDYKDYLACEREVMRLRKKHKKKLKAYVMCSGFTYGFEEESLDFLFKMAWTNEKYLPLFFPGNNRVPLVYVTDLAKIIHQIMENTPKKLHYILAVEQTPTKLKKIVRAISKTLGTGRIKEVMNVNEATKFSGINEANYKKFCVNLNMEPAFVMENFQIEWTTELSLPDNIEKIVEEFKTARNLNPIRIYMHGPPGSGKTRLAKKLCERYNLHYVSIATMIQETLQDLRDNITDEKNRIKAKEERAHLKQLNMEENEEEEDEQEEEEEEEEQAEIEEWEEQIRDIQTTLTESEDNKLPEEQVVRLMRTFLMKNYCQNQGFVLDGYPKTIEQAKELLGLGEEGEEDQLIEEEEIEEGQVIDPNNPLLPHFVFSLQADDSFLNQRMMKLKQKDIEGTRYTEDMMKIRLQRFREMNTEDNTVLNFFDELEIHPMLIDIMEHDTEEMEGAVELVESQVGAPISFGDTLEEVLVQQFLAESKLKLELEEIETQKKTLEREAIEDYRNKTIEWLDTLESIKKEEEKVIIAEQETLRNYLMEFVFPVLTKALIDVAKVKPDDPVDYVAEYLFQENPEAKMFDPSYSKKGEEILQKCEEAIDPLVK